MPIQKATTTINFAQGIDTMGDPNQLAIGKFVYLKNSVFVQGDGGGRLNKRNGFGTLSSIPSTSPSFLTTFKDNLLAIGTSLQAYSANTNTWISTGYIQPLQFSTQALSRNFYSPTMVDAAQSNGVVGYTFTVAPIPPGGTAFYYAAADAKTGQYVITPTTISPNGGAQTYGSRIFSLNNKFVVVFDGTSGGVAQLQYFTIDALTLAVGASGTVSSTYQNASGSSSQLSFDGAVSNNKLFLSYNTVNGITAATINSAFQVSSGVNLTSNRGDMISVSVDNGSGFSVFTTYMNYAQVNPKVFSTTPSLTANFNVSLTGSGGSQITNIASTAIDGYNYTLLEYAKSYTYGSTYATNFVGAISTQVQGSISSQTIVARSLGLASKAFAMNGAACFLSMYSSQNQSTYFLNAVSFLNNFQVPGLLYPLANNIAAKFAYGNAYSQVNVPTTLGYMPSLPAVSVIGSSASVAYMLNTQIASINKGTNIGSANSANIIYSSPGINYANFDFGTNGFQTREIANNLHMSGGVMLMHDGNNPVEHNFFLYPDNTFILGSAQVGAMAPITYYYQSLYKWTDGQGNIHRSAPSLPQSVVLSSGTSQVLLSIPCPRVTYKTSTNPIVCSIYRWSTGLQTYFKIQPDIVFDSTALKTESITVGDTKSDAQIIGNEILYTNGNVVEDISAPPSSGMAIFDTRLWLIDAEDPNLLWFSKPCIEGTPVEMSDLLTYFVPPSSNEVASSGPCRCISAMDDKLIIFKNNSIFYVNGTGPDITGANSQYSTPIFITSGVGCTNPASIVLVKDGLMFQSAKGIWMLGRDMSVTFIGKEAEDFNTCNVLSSQAVPGTNQARFTLGSSGQTLVYDYLAGQWNQFIGSPAISSAVYKGLHTNLQTSGSVTQETANVYLDGGVPTTTGFTTGWIGLGGLQGYVRAYKMFILGKFLSPHTYTVGIAYDYNPTIVQTALINPTNSVGSGSSIEQWQINFQQQQTQAFQLTFTEISSSTAGAGLYLSGIKIVYGQKVDYPRNIGAINKTS